MEEIDLNEALELSSPYPYTLVTSLDKDGKPNIIGISWWTFTSLDPQMMAISVGHSRYSHECIEHSKEFVICFPTEEMKRGAWLCGKRSGRDINKFEAAEFEAVPSKVVKPPTIGGSTVAYECRMVDQVSTGDHTLFIGEVMAIRGTPGKEKHLYTVHYKKLLSIDRKGELNFGL